MTRAVRAIALAALFSFAVIAYPAQASFHCATMKTQVAYLLNNGYAFLASGTIDGGAAALIFVSPNTGDWVIVGVDENESSCILIKGKELRFAVGGDA